MNDTLIAIVIFTSFLGILVLSILLLRLLPSKGEFGERSVSRRLKGLPTDKYIIFNDVILPTKTGTTQIDHIVISIYGVFVIETKFYKGWIVGGEDNEYWTQKIYGKKHRFYNPILQNGGHIRKLKRLLSNFVNIPFFPIVTFSKQANLKIKTTYSRVTYWNDLVSEIKSHSTERLSWNEVNEIGSVIQLSMLDSKDKKIRKQHNRNVKMARFQKQTMIEFGKCPRCGGSLVLRNGQYGRFYGCSNYPACKFTQEY
jgi:hypothetical protein